MSLSKGTGDRKGAFNNINIGFLSHLDPENRLNFSGTLFYMLDSLKRLEQTNIHVLGKRYFSFQKRSFLLRCLDAAGRRVPVLKNVARYVHDRCLERVVRKDIKTHRLDYIFAPVASRAIATFHLRAKESIPIVFVTDATPAFIKDYYGWPIEDSSYEQERKALERSQHVIYSSDYMAQLATKEYADLFRNRNAHAIPFGLNMDTAPSESIEKQLDDKIELIFVGRFWKRKGGEFALGCLDALVENGINANLTIIGCEPPVSFDSEHVSVIPFLDKNDPQQQAEYYALLTKAHFLLLPTRADCTPMVIAEANAFSVPALSTDVGGIPTLINDGENGYLMDLRDPGTVYAEKIMGVLKSKTHYLSMSQSSFEVYKAKLNWDAWAGAVFELIRSETI